MKFPLLLTVIGLFNKKKIQPTKQVKTEQAFNTNNHITLKSSLKQLEFISFLEIHLSNKELNEFSLNFLIELTKIKHQAKSNTIKSIRFFKE